jgi:hypothetical protein
MAITPALIQPVFGDMTLDQPNFVSVSTILVSNIFQKQMQIIFSTHYGNTKKSPLIGKEKNIVGFPFFKWN